MRATGAPFLRAVSAQARVELLLTLRRGESVLITLLVPVLLLLFFASIPVIPADYGAPVDFLLPGMLALAVMSTGMVSLSIATAYERHYGVLKRLGGTPLPRSGLIGAKIISVLAIEVVQILLLVAVGALAYGWRFQGALWAAGLVLLLGTVTFAGIGLAMAGALRAETTLAAANGLYLVLLLLGGMVWPVERLPAALAAVAPLLPSAALARALRAAMTEGAALPGGSVLLLALWGCGSALLAVRTFRWE